MIELLREEINNALDRLAEGIQALEKEEQIDALNMIRERLHALSPLNHNPVDLVLWLPAEKVQGNDYNPNNVAPPEMRLLRHSIRADGFTQPVVAWPDNCAYTVVDGFHRTRVAKECPDVLAANLGRVPVVAIRPDRVALGDRIGSTIRHNRARGVHGVVPMGSIVETMIREGRNDADICKDLGMDADELLRFKQNLGLPDLFKNQPYSQAWE